MRGEVHVAASARHTGRIVGGTQHSLLALRELGEVTMAPHVVSCSEHIDPGLEELLCRALGDSNATGRVLRVGDGEVYSMALHQVWEARTHRSPSWPAYDIAYEQQIQARSLVTQPYFA